MTVMTLDDISVGQNVGWTERPVEFWVLNRSSYRFLENELNVFMQHFILLINCTNYLMAMYSCKCICHNDYNVISYSLL